MADLQQRDSRSSASPGGASHTPLPSQGKKAIEQPAAQLTVSVRFDPLEEAKKHKVYELTRSIISDLRKISDHLDGDPIVFEKAFDLVMEEFRNDTGKGSN